MTWGAVICPRRLSYEPGFQMEISIKRESMEHFARKLGTWVASLFFVTAVLLGTAVHANALTPGTFIATGTMTTARAGHTATLLDNGKVLITGGTANDGSSAVASAELYDPATGTFSGTGSMAAARLSHTATLLNN